jgi:CheY-like chemotaxis protein
MDDYKKYVLLIVDDEETLRNAIMFDFTRKGFTVLSAENGTKAIELVKSNRIHVVISDIRMPGGDGITLLEQIRAIDPNIPNVILVTGFAEVSEAECLAKGAKKVFQKPFDRKALMNEVINLVAGA